MSERKWTAAQKSAIDFRGRDLILSAAAGSGKTATLTERIIRLLQDPDSGAELSRMLIVTFTVAAAEELKSRISASLGEAMAKDPENVALARQLAALEGAHISTIDSFFKSELRPYFSAIGMPPEFSVLDEAEASILKSDAMRDTVSDHFDGRGSVSAEEFSRLCDCVSDARSERDLAEKLMQISDSLLSYDISPERLRLQALDAKSKKGDFLKTDYALAIKNTLFRMSEHFSKCFAILARDLDEDENTKKYVPEAQRLEALSLELAKTAEDTYEGASRFFAEIEFSSLSPLRKEKQTEAYILFKDARNALKAEIAEMTEKFFSCRADALNEKIEETADLMICLSHVFHHYRDLYAEAKRDRGACDFADLALFAKKIFVSKDGTPTKAALETAQKFDYVFIDEYQDTNPVQDAVFSAVSALCGRFMVGDVKQSIYGFRGSCPQLFTDYRKRFEDREGAAAIFMSENFRSDKCVIDLANAVSRYIFATGHTPFEKEDELICSKANGDSQKACEIILCEKESGEGEELPTEAQCVARRISRLLSEETLSDGSAIRPGDIAILLRSTAGAEEYAAALTELGIPVNNGASEDFFAYGEVLLVLCLLNSADNPLRDIYLAGAMKSPVFGFDVNDLVNIRKSTKVPLWYSLMAYCEGGTDKTLLEKCLRVRDTINRWREAAGELYCDELLRLIISDAGLRSYRGDSIRKESDIARSLKILSDHAMAVAKRGGSLHDLIAHLNSVIERKDKSASFKDPDSVTLLTIHKSKGLEYPVCFICSAAKKFNTRDTTEKLLMDKRGNMAMKLYDSKGLVRCDNPLRRAVGLQMKEDAIEEEARVLYVALTRARERLFITCKTKDADESLEKSSLKAYFPLSAHTVMSSSTYGEWILDAMARHGAAPFYGYIKGADIEIAAGEKREKSKKINEDIIAFFEKSLDFSYEKEYLWNIPAKLSVSALKPDILGGDEEERDNLDAPSIISMPDEAPVPAFLQEKKERGAAAKGTATHIFMQFCDFSMLRRLGAEETLAYLIEKRFISKEDAALVRLDEIELFRKSALMDELLEAERILREQRFNTILPAASFTTDPRLREKLLRDGVTVTVQGVIDCIFFDKEGKATLIDYKTDRLTPYELDNKEAAREKLLSRHSRQLTVYRSVCERMLGHPLERVSIYSLQLGRTVDLI